MTPEERHDAQREEHGPAFTERFIVPRYFGQTDDSLRTFQSRLADAVEQSLISVEKMARRIAMDELKSEPGKVDALRNLQDGHPIAEHLDDLFGQEFTALDAVIQRQETAMFSPINRHRLPEGRDPADAAHVRGSVEVRVLRMDDDEFIEMYKRCSAEGDWDVTVPLEQVPDAFSPLTPALREEGAHAYAAKVWPEDFALWEEQTGTAEALGDIRLGALHEASAIVGRELNGMGVGSNPTPPPVEDLIDSEDA